MLTIDANVFVSAASPNELSHTNSDAFLHRAKALRQNIYCPSLLLPEVAAAFSRPTGNTEAARITTDSVATFPDIGFVPLTYQSALAAVQIAIRYRLRGADAVYIAVVPDNDAHQLAFGSHLLREIC